MALVSVLVEASVQQYCSYPACIVQLVVACEEKLFVFFIASMLGGGGKRQYK